MSAAGELALWAALLCALWGAAASVIAVRRADTAFARSADRAVVAVAVLLAVAVAGIVAIELAPDLSYTLAAGTTSTNLPRPFRLAALLSAPTASALIGAALVAAFGVTLIAAPERAKAIGATCAAVGAIVAVAALVGRPYERFDVAETDGRGLALAWYAPWASIARVAFIVFAAVAVTAVLRGGMRMTYRRWALAASALGAIAIVFAMRRSLSGPAWSDVERIAIGAWGLCVALARPWRGAAARALAIASAVAAAGALLGGAWIAPTQLTLAEAVPVTVRGPLGASRTFVSDGRSVYTQLDRRVLAVFIETGRRGGARPEWRVYIDAFGGTRAETPMDAVIAGFPSYVTVGFLAPPSATEAVVRVLFVPLFGLWWMAAILFSAAAIASARQEPRA